MQKVSVVDYGMSNLDSVARAIEECGGTPVIVGRSQDLEDATRIVLPGVGAFGDGMRNIRERGIDRVLRDQVVEKGIPLLGICLGMQLLATTGYEGGATEGLGLIDGEVRRLERDAPATRIPHVGWNQVDFVRESPLFAGIRSGGDFYFVHSYHFVCSDDKDVLATTPYCGAFVSVVSKGYIWGVQFHPEKSQRLGHQLLRNFISL